MNVECANPECRRSIEIIPGHRPRRYCCDRCKQVAYRRRHGQKARLTKSERDMFKVAREISEMKLKWPGLDFGTYYLLQRIREKHGTVLAENVATCILREIAQAKQQS